LPGIRLEFAMNFPAKAIVLTLFALGYCGGLAADETLHRHGPRTQLALPLSGPYALAEAVRLPEWDRIRHLTEWLRTDAGSRRLLEQWPQVRAGYADDSFFLAFVAKWRDRIPVLSQGSDAPEVRNSSWVVLENGPERTITITFPRPGPEHALTLMTITWEDRQITRLNFMSGFGQVLPRHPQVQTPPRGHGRRPRPGPRPDPGMN